MERKGNFRITDEIIDDCLKESLEKISTIKKSPVMIK